MKQFKNKVAAITGAGSGIGAVTRNSCDLAGIKRHLRVVGLYLAGAVGRNHDWWQG